MAEWITLEVINDEAEAYLRKGILEGEGIECVIESIIYRPRAIVTLYNQFKLNVPKEYEARARDILKEAGK